MTKVALIGSTGMLGGMLTDILGRDQSISLIATVRDSPTAEAARKGTPHIDWRALDAETADIAACSTAIRDAQWVINAVGIIKPFIHDDNPAEIERAIRVNALFPHLLSRASAQIGARMIQIATDCVYSGAGSMSTESAPHDALDVYGKTKSLGEAFGPHMANLRCSIIGPEFKSYRSLMEWFRRQPQNAKLTGYTNHVWNGITTLHFARICAGIIKNNIALGHIQHIVPSDTITKADLLERFRDALGRTDIEVTRGMAKDSVDRTLGTDNPVLNRELWAGAGYDEPPSIRQMVLELARYDFRVPDIFNDIPKRSSS